MVGRDNFRAVLRVHRVSDLALRQMTRVILAAVIVVLCWWARPLPAQTPTRADLLATIKHIETLATETQQELDAEKQAHAQTTAALTQAVKANQDTQAQFVSYQQAAETQIKKGNDAITQLNGVIKKLHRAKWILCGLWVAAVGFLVMQLPMAFKQYELIGGAALIAAGCAAIWLWV